MPDWPIWVWVLIAVVVLAIIIAIVVGTNQKKVADHNRAEELRGRAAEEESLLGKRRERADELTDRAESSRAAALAEAERAEDLRREAEAAEERAAYATEDAEVLITEADRSQHDFDSAVEEHDKLLREADRRDPEVRTDRDGNRIVGEDEHRGVDPDGDGLLDRDPDEDVRLGDSGRRLDDTRDAGLHDDADGARHRDDLVVDDGPVVDEQGRRLDPYGNPVDDGLLDDGPTVDDQGRRLDPYGNPIDERN